LPRTFITPLQKMPEAIAGTVHEVRLRMGCMPLFTVQGVPCAPHQLSRELTELEQLRLTPLPADGTLPLSV